MEIEYAFYLQFGNVDSSVYFLRIGICQKPDVRERPSKQVVDYQDCDFAVRTRHIGRISCEIRFMPLRFAIPLESFNATVTHVVVIITVVSVLDVVDCGGPLHRPNEVVVAVSNRRRKALPQLLLVVALYQFQLRFPPLPLYDTVAIKHPHQARA